MRLETLEPYIAFDQRVQASRVALIRFIAEAKAAGKRTAALGASTKGNVLLQYCQISEDDVEFVGEVNPDKFGSFTPGSLIPIVDQAELLRSHFDYLLILPWHFRPFFDRNAKFAGQTLLYPLPTLEVVKVPGEA